MKELVEYSFFREPCHCGASHLLPDDVYFECVQKWPQFKQPGKASFTFLLETADPLLNEIIEFVRMRTGKMPIWHKFPFVWDEFSRYHLTGKRVFDKTDIESAEYLWCMPEKQIFKSGRREEDGLLHVEGKSILSKSIGRGPNSFSLICDDSMRQQILEEGFANIDFKPVKIKGANRLKKVLWEISGFRTLASVTNKLINDQGKDPDEFNSGCWVDDLFFPQILKFKRDVLMKAAGNFDVGVTKEKWLSGPLVRRSPYLICSQRFRQWCEKKKLKLTWVPVVLE